MQLLLCDLFEEAVVLSSSIRAKFAQTHLLSKIKTYCVERILLLSGRPSDDSRVTNRTAFGFGVHYESVAIHDASIHPAKVTTPAAVLTFVRAMVKACHGRMVAPWLPSAYRWSPLKRAFERCKRRERNLKRTV